MAERRVLPPVARERRLSTKANAKFEPKPISKRRATAIRHVVRGRAIVAQQRQLIVSAGELLAIYERSLSSFEDDLKEIEEQEAV